MTAYATDHADALADIRAAGAAVTFSRDVPGTHDPETGLFTSDTTSTVTGYAVKTRGNPETYKALSLIESEAPTLLFAPDTYGSLPALNDSVTWNSVPYVVKSIDALAPDGTAIIARVVIGR